MKDIKNKKQIVEDLVNTFNDRDQLHIAYKRLMKNILINFLSEFSDFIESKENIDEEKIINYIEDFVEVHFIPKK